MKKALLIFSSLLLSKAFNAQQNYCDFEGSKYASLALWNGQMDSMHANPAPSAANTSSFCGMYIRSSNLYDNFKYFPYAKLVDVTAYANSSASAPKMSMKVYTNAAPGTIINVQLGSKNDPNYPTGIHSEYTGVTSAKNAWQTINFNFVQATPGSSIAPTDIDKVVIFFHPNSSATDTVYFDDFMGPQLIIIGVQSIDPAPTTFAMTQNFPNPANESTSFKIMTDKPGKISVELFNILGTRLTNLVDQELAAGVYPVTINTSSLAEGVYYLRMKKDEQVRTIKMSVHR